MSSSDSPSPKNYDVFINFRGEDTRATFATHLHEVLCNRGIRTYIDYMLYRGEAVRPALSKAIEESYISIVVFSENYASSKWCLDELVKILQCRKDEGQVVIPVFYNVDPSHIRKQTGSYQTAFAKHERDFMENKSNQHKLSLWKVALTKTANISGWDSRSYQSDSQIIQNIVNDVTQKLNLRYPNELEGLLGIDEHCKSIESLLEEVRVIGIWGMGGIGKTTIAKALFIKLFPQYDSVCFLANVNEESKRLGLTSLRDKLLFELLKEESPKSNVGSEIIMRRLRSKKVLVVLDDVDNFKQLENLYKEGSELGQDSRLVITTRNRQLLIGRAEEIYNVKKWDIPESLELFCLNAFKESHPPKGYEDLSKRALDYAGGVPLALKVLGSYLRSESPEFWDNELSKLKKHPNEDIQEVLRVSYDGLKELEQEIFLDIAFFFKDDYKDDVIRILDACGFYAANRIKVLEDKALITISKSNRIQMHSLIQETGLKIVHEEFGKEPGRRSRLKDIDEVCGVLQNGKGTSAVEGITLDLSQIKEDLHLSANTFKMMNNLRFLKFYISSDRRSGNVHLPRGLEKISENLRYLEWNGYPWKSLPPKFCGKFLVEIRMPHSHIQELWQEIQVLQKLEGIDLSECKKLTKLPDLSEASKLKWVNLSGCESLCDVHPSVLSSDTLVTLILDRCKKLKSLKSKKHLTSLKTISVNGCTNLSEFSVSSDLIETLDLSNTGIEILDTSIGRLSKLWWLNLDSLRLQHFLQDLSCLTSLKELRISNCGLDANNQNLHVLFDGVRSLRILHFKDCYNLSKLPDNISVLSWLHELRLDGRSVETLPLSIKHLPELEILSLKNCKKLRWLPELSTFISRFYAANCTLLESVSTLKTFAIQMKGKEKYISFENGMKLDGRSLHRIMEGAQLTATSTVFHNVLVRTYRLDSYSHNYDTFKICFPGSRVPRQFTYRKNDSSITIELPSHYQLLGLILSTVLSPSSEIVNSGAKIFCQCYLEAGKKLGHATRWYHEATKELNSDHVYVWYDPFHCDSILRSYKQKVSFEFYVTNDAGKRDGLIIDLKECGVHLIYESEFHNFLRELDMELESKLKLGLELGAELGLYKGMEMESQRRAILTAIEKPDEKEDNDTRTQINQEQDLSEKTSYDHILITEAMSDMPDPQPKGRERSPLDEEEKQDENSIREKETGKEKYETEDQIDESLDADLLEEAPTSPSLHMDPVIHNVTVEEPEKEKTPMNLDIPDHNEDSDEDPLAELESILMGSHKDSPKSAKSSTIFLEDTAVSEALHNLECLLQNSFDSLLGDEELCQQLDIALNYLADVEDKLPVEVVGLVNSMKSSVGHLFKHFPAIQKIIDDHVKCLNKKTRLTETMNEAKKCPEILNGKRSECKIEVDHLNQEINDLNNQIQDLVEKRSVAEAKQRKLIVELENYENKKRKLKDDARQWVKESKEVLLAIENSEATYEAALSKREKMEEKWKSFQKDMVEKIAELQNGFCNQCNNGI